MRNSMAKKQLIVSHSDEQNDDERYVFPSHKMNAQIPTKGQKPLLALFSCLPDWGGIFSEREDNSASLEQFVWVCCGFPIKCLPVTCIRVAMELACDRCGCCLVIPILEQSTLFPLCSCVLCSLPVVLALYPKCRTNCSAKWILLCIAFMRPNVYASGDFSFFTFNTKWTIFFKKQLKTY